VAVVQYTFTHKQYTEQHNETEYTERNIHNNNIYKLEYYGNDGPDSSVGVATHYRLESPGIEPQWGRDFPQSSGPALGPTHLPVHWLPGIFSGDKAAGTWS
jgi:hypothetical protein